MNFDLPEDVQQLVARARDFREQVLAPLEPQFLADGNVPWPLRPRLQAQARDEHGLWAIDVPREHGGLGMGQLAVCAVHEELNKHPMMFETGGAPEPVLYHCAPHQWEPYFGAVVSGEKRSAYAFTEPGTGSDLGAIQTTAVRDGDEWVIDGHKLFIGLAERVEFLILFASTDPARGARGVTVFLLDRGTPGYEVVRTIPTMGDAWDPCELRFDDCRVPDAQRLGAVNEGFATADHQLSHGRLKIASYQLGIAQRCIDLAVAWAQERTTWGRPIASRQGIQFMLADSAVELDAARLLVYRTAWAADRGDDVRTDAFKAKLFATEMAQRVTDRCLQVFGGRGYARDSPVQSFFRQARLWRIGHGTAEIHRWMIARDLLGEGRSMSILEGRAGVVTGGSRGLGRAIVEAFTAAGAQVAILDTDGAQEAAAEIGGATLGLTGDVTDAAGVERAFGEVAERFGRFDFLINNAGIRAQAPFAEHPLDVWKRTLDVNLTGSFVCAQAAIALMLPRGGGSIVNLASIAGAIALKERAAYNASKGGVIALTQSIAAEMSSSGIRCNAIAPGIIETPLSAPYFRDERMIAAITANTPLGRWGQPHEIAAPAVFLCSPAAEFVHGHTLFVDGGWMAFKGY